MKVEILPLGPCDASEDLSSQFKRQVVGSNPIIHPIYGGCSSVVEQVKKGLQFFVTVVLFRYCHAIK